MKYTFTRSRLMAVMAALALASSVWALNLPVKSVRGVDYFYHEVRKGESLYGISKHIGVPADDIVKYNPAASAGVSKGDILLFPCADFAPAEDDELPTDEAITPDEVSSPAEAQAALPVIGVLMPFGSQTAEPTRRNKLALDFYKGFLIGIDTLSMRPTVVKVTIVARDTEGRSPEELRTLIADDSLLSRAAVIIGPDDDASLRAVASEAAANRTYIFNALNIRDSLYLSNSFMLQANATQKAMYQQAVDAMLHDFEGYTPVILRSSASNDNRIAFISYLTERYRALGVEPLSLGYNANLLMADLESLPHDGGQKYLFVPADGSVSEFNRFCYVLRSFRDKLNTMRYAELTDEAEPVLANPAEVQLFGYPDWTAFRGEALDMLHKLEATVYSRFLDDFNGFDVRNIAADFRRWYGTHIDEGVPSYGLLGYDSARFLLRNLRSNNGAFEPVTALPFNGLQSTFAFEQPDGVAGYINNSIYIIRYQPGGAISARAQ